MRFDVHEFNIAYKAFAEDIVEKLQRHFPKQHITLVDKEYKLDEKITLNINNHEFEFDLIDYIDDAAEINESIAFIKLQLKIQCLLDNSHI